VARGRGVARALLRAAATFPLSQGPVLLTLWVGSENGRAVAFASGFGFRPTAERRPMRVVSEDDEDEVAMVLALGGDRGSPPGDI
jgi:ribosomal protein S18 acetylase RimI-like enzyme